MRLPLVSDPQRYRGLYAIDFGAWTALGFTGEEVAWLLASDEHAEALAYRVERVDGDGRMELRGVSRTSLAGSAMMLFASVDSDKAFADFQALQQAARAQPPPHAIEIALLDLPGENPHAVSLRYALHAESLVAAWLTETGFAGGDVVTGGDRARQQVAQADAAPVATAVLAADVAFQTRSPNDILANIRNPLQR